jgi:hypothetical protein
MRRVALLFLVIAAAYGQTPPPISDNSEFFRVDFALKDLEGGKVISVHNYQMMVRALDPGTSSIRSGGRVPVGGEKGFTFIDVGVNLDVKRMTRVREEVTFDLVAEISGAADSDKASLSNPPTIRQTRWNSVVVTTLRKPTTVFSSDDPTSKRQLQLEVTVAPVR